MSAYCEQTPVTIGITVGTALTQMGHSPVAVMLAMSWHPMGSYVMVCTLTVYFAMWNCIPFSILFRIPNYLLCLFKFLISAISKAPNHQMHEIHTVVWPYRVNSVGIGELIIPPISCFEPKFLLKLLSHCVVLCGLNFIFDGSRYYNATYPLVACCLFNSSSITIKLMLMNQISYNIIEKQVDFIQQWCKQTLVNSYKCKKKIKNLS